MTWSRSTPTRTGGDRPPRLIGFARVEVGAGKEAEVVLRIPVERLAQRDTNEHRMVVRPGDYEVKVTRNRGEPGVTSQSRSRADQPS